MISYYMAAQQTFFSQAEKTEESANEQFKEAYLSKDLPKAKSYLDRIDVDYNKGYFLKEAAKKGDIDMLRALLEKGPTAGLLEALGEAACDGYMDCVQELMDHVGHTDPTLLKEAIVDTSHPRAKEFFASHHLTREFFVQKEQLAKPQKTMEGLLTPDEPSLVKSHTSPTPSALNPVQNIYENLHALASSKAGKSESINLFSYGSVEAVKLIKAVKISKKLIKFSAEVNEISGRKWYGKYGQVETERLRGGIQKKLLDINPLSDLTFIKMDEFIFQKDYSKNISSIETPATDLIVKHFGIKDLFASGVTEKITVPLSKSLRYLIEHEIFKRALQELESQSTTTESKDADSGRNIVVVDIFASNTSNKLLKINPKTMLTETYAVVLWKQSENNIVLINPSQQETDIFVLNHLEFLHLQLFGQNLGYSVFDSQEKLYASQKKLAKDGSSPQPKDYVDMAVRTAFNIIEQDKKGIDPSDVVYAATNNI